MKQFFSSIVYASVRILFWHFIISTILIILFALAPIALNLIQIQIISLAISLILFLETFLKLSHLRAIDNLNPPESTISNFLDRKLLDPDTLALEELGFIRIIEYSVFSDRVIYRVLAQPEQYCFAQVFQMNNISLAVIISSHLERDWSLAIATTKPDANSYVLYRQPKHLVRFMENSKKISPSLLLSSLLQWRQEVMSTLKLNLVRDTTAEYYWEWHYRVQKKQKRKLSKKIMTFALVEMLIFALKPKTEWLEEYEKARQERS